MPKYHINKKTGRPNICYATIRDCPVGGTHYNSKQEAREGYEQDNKEKTLTKLTKKNNNIKENKELEKLGLNIHYIKNDPIDRHIFCNPSISGKIDYTQLDNQSYKQFGFKLLSEDEKSINMDRVYFENSYDHNQTDEILNSSIKETDKLSFNEQKLLHWYSGDDYAWVNEECYNPDPSTFDKKYKPNEENEYYTKIFHLKPYSENNFFDNKFDREERDHYTTNINPYGLNHKQFEKLITELDNTLNKGPKKQRIVYHGKTIHPEKSGYKTSADWIKGERGLGTVVSFDGYMSTSVLPEMAANFSGASDDGVIYEILTPEGVNITSCSANDLEYEVLLPREQKYMVVGSHVNKNLDIGVGYHGRKRKAHIVQLVAINDNEEILDGSNSTKPEPLYNKK